MTNPLDDSMETLQMARDAIKVARRVMDRRPNPVSNTGFLQCTSAEGHEILDRVEERIGGPVAFSLFAAFERSLRDHLANNLGPLAASSTTPLELGQKLHEYLESGVNNWPVDGVIDLFCTPASDRDANHAKGIRTYRHHVAHGAAPPVAIPPQKVYSQLSDFLRNAGLVP